MFQAKDVDSLVEALDFPVKAILKKQKQWESEHAKWFWENYTWEKI